jgi:pimeloyl-ACP methyl ester carboxylesterase
MPSLTPLHETYCRWDRTPLSQADLLEGLAQLMSIQLLGLQERIQPRRLMLFLKTLGLNPQQIRTLMANPLLHNSLQQGLHLAERSGQYLIAPALRIINQHLPTLVHKDLSPQQHSLVGMLNGILGNYLIRQQNPLALPMILYDHYGQPQHGELAGRVVIMVHGLCMTHLSWTQNLYAGIGEKLLAQRDCNIMLYLNYNSGRRISANGKSLSLTLEQLIRDHPRISRIDLIGHSMGGLVCRSALFYGKQDLRQWMNKVANIVCIASPHQGAALERLGYMLQDHLGRLPLLGRIGRLTNIRSDGILDLRYGSVRDDDWEHLRQRTGNKQDSRKPAPIPGGINCFLVAGSIETRPNQSKALEAIGDYLVSISSALGEHPNPKFKLNVPEAHKAIFYGLNHMEVQCNAAVAEQIARWLYPDPLSDSALSIHELSHQSHEHYHHHSMYDLQGIAET